MTMFRPNSGLVNILLTNLGVISEGIPFLNEKWHWAVTYLLIGVWQTMDGARSSTWRRSPVSTESCMKQHDRRCEPLEENVAYHTSRYQEYSSNTTDPEPRTCHGK